MRTETNIKPDNRFGCYLFITPNAPSVFPNRRQTFKMCLYVVIYANQSNHVRIEDNWPCNVAYIIPRTLYAYYTHRILDNTLKLRSHRAPGPPRTVPDPIRGDPWLDIPAGHMTLDNVVCKSILVVSLANRHRLQYNVVTTLHRADSPMVVSPRPPNVH